MSKTLADYRLENRQLKAENKELRALLKVRIEDLCDSCGASSMMPMPCHVYKKALLDIGDRCKVKVSRFKKMRCIMDGTISGDLVEELRQIQESIKAELKRCKWS